jgi:uncharacterized membrane protein
MDIINDAVVWIEAAALILELLAVVIIMLGISVATIRYFYYRVKSPNTHYYREYRASIGNSLLLGLEILIAADIINTVALEPTWESVGILGLLVLIRTFLSWSLFVDIEERWPWQKRDPLDGPHLGEGRIVQDHET